MADLLAEKDDPEAVATAISQLVKKSLQQEERQRLAEDEDLLSSLGDLLEHDLASMAGFAAEGDGTMRLQKEAPKPELVAAHEDAAASCLKLARNLAVGNPEIQGRWWRRGLVERLAVQARCDLAAPNGERSAAWCEAVPSFMANILANNPELRAEALEALWPHGLATVLAMCAKRPDHGFLLLQNLFSGGHRQRLSEDGCVFHVILSLLRVDDSELSPAVAAKAKDWAAIFFSTLWNEGLFVGVFRVVKDVTASKLHTFLRAAAAVPGWGALGTWESSTALAAESFGRLMSRLCGQKEALGLLWHTVRGLLGGLDSEDMSVSGVSEDSVRLARQLLSDESFVDLAAQEMCSAIVSHAATWDLELDVSETTPEACDVLGLAVKDVDVALLAAEAFEDTYVEGNPVESEMEASGAFREMLFASIELAAIPCGQFPPKLTGVYLWANVKLIQALHHLRFGTAAVAETGAPLPGRKEPTQGQPQKAVKAALACQLVGQLRLCGNVLFESPQAADFLRLSGGLPALLSHCYADPELPLLREAGVYAVRNATQHSPETRDHVRRLLAERRTKDPSAGAGPLPMIEETALF